MSDAKSHWSEIRIGDILKFIEEPIGLDDSKEYVTITVRRRHGGLETRERLLGYQIKTKKQLRPIPGAFIISRIQCWHQAYAIIPEEVPENMIVSTNYDQFLISPNIDAQFFWWLSHSSLFTETVRSSAFGVVIEKMVFNRDAWLGKTIPVPPLEEQRRIVSRIEELDNKIEPVRLLREQAENNAEALFAASLSGACVGSMTERWRRHHPDLESAHELLNRIAKVQWPGHVKSREPTPINLPPPPPIPPSWLIVRAGELQQHGAILDIQDGNHGSDYPRKAEFGDEGVPFVTAKQIKGGTALIAEAPRLPKERAKRLRIGFAKAGDVLLTHNASVGDVAVAPANAGDFILGTSVTYWRCNREALEPLYLFYFMRSEYFQGQLQFIMKQTTRNQVSVLKQVNLWICFPPLTEQRLIVSELDRLQAKLNALTHLQAETAAELDALLPSILAKAFRGEL